MTRRLHQSGLVRCWNAVSRLRGGTRRALSKDRMLAAAAAKYPASPQLEPDTSAAFGTLVDAINDTARLHAFGRFYVSQFLTGLLVNRRRLGAYWAEHRDIFEAELRKPVIILGLPRSGTSFLFNLLAQDPAHRYLANWETTVSQAPPPRVSRPEDDPRRRVGRLLMLFQRYLAPHLEDIHEFHLDGPEECTPLLMQGFDTQALAGMFDIPAYSAWLDTVDHRPAYAHHKRILQTLQATYPGQRWLLKSPDHLAALGPLLQTYPDACLVHLHRDPVQAVSSWASLNAAFRGIWSEEIDSGPLGAQILDRLAKDMDAYLAARDRIAGAEARILDLPYRELIGAPLAAVERIYAHFDLELNDSARSRLNAFLSLDRKKQRSHAYAPEDFGLSPERIRKRFAHYIDRFVERTPA